MADNQDNFNAPFIKILLENLNKNIPQCGSRSWVIDAVSGTTVRFDEVDELSRRAASALYKLGFRRGHVLYFVTYEMAHLYVAMLAAWRLGGSVRGSNQREKNAEKFVNQMRESHVKFVLLDAETAPILREAVSMLKLPVCLINVGSNPVEGATNFTDLLLDDGKDFPDDVDIDVNEDVVYIGNTSGSTGNSKTVLHTSVSAIFSLATLDKRLLSNNEDTCMTFINNFPLSNIAIVMSCLYYGVTCISLGIFYDTSTFFDHLMKHKPSSAFMYPFTAAWFIRNQQHQSLDLSFFKCIGLFGTALDKTSGNLFMEKFPHVTLNMFYASTECLILAATNTPAGCITTFEFEGKVLTSAGKAAKNVEIRVVDAETGKPLGPGDSGEIVVKTPSIMRGYMRQGAHPDPPKVDEEGWYHMEDLGLMDKEGNVYIIERLKFLFRYITWDFISPIEIEGVIQEHKAVEAAAVIPIPDSDKINLARAYVVLRPECHASAGEILTHVANRLPEHKHLHGGVTFVTSLPLNSGGKIDRAKMRNMVTREV